MREWLSQEMLLLFLILPLGYWIGQIKIKGIAFGSAGVLFIALAFGYAGFSLPKSIMDIGLVLFVYSVGLQVGPKFFSGFRKQGIRFILIGLVATIAGGIATLLVTKIWHFPVDIACGLYTGSLTNTPALAAAMDSIARFAQGSADKVSTGYGIAYPFAMIWTVLLVQSLPIIFHSQLSREEKSYLAEEEKVYPDLVVRTIQLNNPEFNDKTITDINPGRQIQATITRIKRGESVLLIESSTHFKLGDIILAVGTQASLEQLSSKIGAFVYDAIDFSSQITTSDIEMNQPSLAGKTLKELDIPRRFGVIITRVRKGDFEITPFGNLMLDMGDGLHLVGPEKEMKKAIETIQGETRYRDETNMLPFLTGLFMGIALGQIPIPISGGTTINLGSAGGVFLLSLILGHYRKIGTFYWYVPKATNNFGRDFGILLFLAGVGTSAGSKLVSAFQQNGISLLLAGLCITIFTSICTLSVLLIWYRKNMLFLMGAISAATTNPPALSAASGKTKTSLPALGYASVYPAALILKILFVQLLAIILSAWF